MSQQQGSYYLQLNTLAYALMGGVLIFALGAAFIESQGGMQMDTSLGNIFVSLSIGLGLVSGVSADVLFRKRVETIRPDQPLYTRKERFRTATIMHLAFLEGAALFGIVAFMVSGATIPMVVAIVLLGWMTLNRPSVSRLEKFMHLTEEEKPEVFG